MPYELPFSGEEVEDLLKAIEPHIEDNDNPHGVTKVQVGLGNVDNTSDTDKTVCNAEQLLASVGVTEKVPYLFRESGGDVDIGNRESDKIVGGTVAWNQLVQNGDFADASNWVADAGVVLAISNNVGKVTAIATLTQAIKISSLQNIPTGHKVFGCLTVKAQTSGHYFGMSLNNTTLSKNTIVPSSNEMPTSWRTFAGITEIVDELGSRIAITNATAMSVDDYFEIKNVQIIDLTQMFGSTIADYIYSLEQGTAGAGVAWFKALFPKSYYAYNAGTLMSVNASKHNTIGFNQWNEEWELGLYDTSTGEKGSSSTQIRCKNLIRVVGGKSYHLSVGGGAAWAVFFDYDGNILYRPLEGQGLTRSNNAYQVGKSTDPIAYFTLPENCYYMAFYMTANYGTTYNNDICLNFHGSHDGEYKPTEEYVVTEQGGVAIPVGHETFYHADLKGKLEDAPNNPTEDGDYIVRRAGGVNTYFKLPAIPSTDGTYSFKATVSGGTVTLSWEA